LGLGVPASTPSLGELLAQGKDNLDAWWITVSTFDFTSSEAQANPLAPHVLKALAES
jgi:hypothetical protein